ncbi:MAG: hypothetical protein QW197_01925 [Candidatus Aenigmatarchaeota archaeon]
MKLLEEVGIRFLIGLFIAALIAFLFWWFVIHNETDRIVERNFIKFYNALDNACKNLSNRDNPTTVYIEIPQRRFENVFQEAAESLKSFLGFNPPLPYSTLGDPYYKFYWEKFPPEPPYEFGQGLLQSLAAIFIPWSEDLPWSSNLLLSMTLATFFGGIDFLKASTLKNLLSKGVGTFSFELKKFSTRVYNILKEKLEPLVNAIEKGEKFVLSLARKTKEYLIEIKETTIKICTKTFGNEKCLDNIKFASKTTVLYAGICFMISEEDLEDCLIYGALGGIVTTKAKVMFYENVWKRIVDRIKTKFYILKQDVKNSILSFVEYLSNSVKMIKDAIKNFSKEGDELLEFENKIDEIEKMLEEARKDVIENNIELAREKLKEAEDMIEEAEGSLNKIESKPNYEKDLEALRAVFNNLKTEINNFRSVIENFEFTSQFKGFLTINEFNSIIDSVAETSLIKPVEKILEKKGFVYSTELKRLVLDYEKINLDENEFAKDLKIAIESRNELLGQKISRYEDFFIEYDSEGKVKRIIYDPYDPESFTATIKEYLFGYPKKFLAHLSYGLNLIHDKLIDGDLVREALLTLKNRIEKDENFAQKAIEAFKKYGVTDKNELLRMVDNTIKKYESGENLVLVVSKDSLLGQRLIELEQAGKLSYSEILSAFRQVLFEGIEKGDKREIERLYGLLAGKTLRIREDLAEFMTENPIGYASLRAIDLYTPLGASYWDRYFSLYGYEGQRVPLGCQTSCDDGKVCVQLGACVRQYELPESCKKLGIENIKLERSSIIAANPRFYLVSPCYANLKIYINATEAVIYVKPEIDKSKLSSANYCYATESYINTYVGSLIGEYAASAALLFVPGIGPILSWILNIGMSFFRDGMFVWPVVYQYFPNLA